MSRTVVITGFGASTPLGVDAPSTWEAMPAGRSGVHTLQQEWAADLPVTFAAETADPVERLDRVAARRLDRSSQLAMVAGLRRGPMQGPWSRRGQRHRPGPAARPVGTGYRRPALAARAVGRAEGEGAAQGPPR